MEEVCALRLLALILSICQAREPLKGRNEACLIVVLTTRHDGEDLAHHHMGK
jgi:hypothetical protein